MSKNKLHVDVSVDDEKGEVKITLSDEAKSRIPRPGESIYIVAPYPVVSSDDVDDEEITSDDVKENLPEAYSYAGTMVKSSVLNDECDEVLVNGDYRIPLYKDRESSRKRLLIFTNETEARDKFRTLMGISIKEATRRVKLAENIQQYLEEALEKMHH